MGDPICSFCQKQLPQKRERVLLTGQSKEASMSVVAAAAYLIDQGSQQTLEQVLSRTGGARLYLCTKCSNLLKRWFNARADLRSTTTLHCRFGEQQHHRIMPGDISVPDVDLGPPQAASSPVHAMQHIRDGEPCAKRRTSISS